MKGLIDPFFEAQMQPGKTSHYLLGGWRDILEDIQRLAAGVDKLPEHCACGDPTGHRTGHCACCMDGTAARGCKDCEALLTDIAGRIEALRADALRFTPALRDVASWRSDHDDMGRHLADVTVHASRLVRVVEGVQVAAAEFREGCRVDQLARLKERVRELRDEAKRLDRKW